LSSGRSQRWFVHSSCWHHPQQEKLHEPICIPPWRCLHWVPLLNC
jgi:hypothetical protein